MSQITSQIHFKPDIYENNSSVIVNPQDIEELIFHDIVALREISKRKLQLQKKISKDLLSDIFTTNFPDISATFLERENKEIMELDETDFEINEFVDMPPKEIITKKIKIESIKKAEPIIFD